MDGDAHKPSSLTEALELKVRDKESSLTPVMRQYRALKERYPDAILLFRMGDFYEMFYEDAVVASKVLGIALTSRDKTKENPVPMAGVPCHAVTSYLKKLLQAGFRAAVCEQMEEPSKGKGIVAREVVRVITPGVNVETELLEAKESNYLLAIAEGTGASTGGMVGVGAVSGRSRRSSGVSHGGAVAALVVADISTGYMMAAQVDDMQILASELVRFGPREVLIPRRSEVLASFVGERLPDAAVTRSSYFEEYADYGKAIEKVNAVIGGGCSEGAGCWQILPPSLALVCAALLEYLGRTQPGRPLPIKRIGVYKPSHFMILDETTVRHLELVLSTSGDKKGSLLWLLDATRTPMGARLLRSWLLTPLMDVARIRRRQDAVEHFVLDQRARAETRGVLGDLCDIERIVSRCIVKAAVPRDLGALRDTLQRLPDLAERLGNSGFFAKSSGEEDFPPAFPSLPQQLAKLLEAALVPSPPPHAREGGIFAKGYNAELDELIYLSTSSKEAIARLELQERERTGIGSLKVRYNKVFGYYIEVTKANLSLVPQERYLRKQTMVGGERYVTEELKELEWKILTADERRKVLEAELFSRLVDEVAAFEKELREVASFVAAVDVVSALAEVAATRGYSRPVVDEGGAISIVDGRHPIVEALGAPDGFVPNDVELDIDGERVWIITGPNMSGKSTFMRQVALCVIMAQVGSFIPASKSRIGICDRIFTRVGASDNLSWGQSTFMVEMTETASILNHATKRSLVVLDEIGRGTSTFDGMSIAWATAEYLHNRVGCRTLLATHYHELTQLAKDHPHIANYNVSAMEYGDKIIFLRKVTKGSCSRSYGIQVAQLAGMPAEVIARAKEILSLVEAGGAAVGGPGILSQLGLRAGKRGTSAQWNGAKGQLTLFEIQPRSDPHAASVLELLKQTNIEGLTPLEALNFLSRLKGMIKA